MACGGAVEIKELLARVSRLPASRQQEVMDFVAFLEQRYGHAEALGSEPASDWTEQEYEAMSVHQAMRGLEDEPELYTDDDLKERWH
jgi:hypothetical protein